MPIAVGQTAPDFTLKDQSQKDVKLADFAGKRNVSSFFIRWISAPSAQMSMPASSTT